MNRLLRSRRCGCESRSRSSRRRWATAPLARRGRAVAHARAAARAAGRGRGRARRAARAPRAASFVALGPAARDALFVAMAASALAPARRLFTRSATGRRGRADAPARGRSAARGRAAAAAAAARNPHWDGVGYVGPTAEHANPPPAHFDFGPHLVAPRAERRAARARVRRRRRRQRLRRRRRRARARARGHDVVVLEGAPRRRGRVPRYEGEGFERMYERAGLAVGDEAEALSPPASARGSPRRTTGRSACSRARLRRRLDDQLGVQPAHAAARPGRVGEEARARLVRGRARRRRRRARSELDDALDEVVATMGVHGGAGGRRRGVAQPAQRRAAARLRRARASSARRRRRASRPTRRRRARASSRSATASATSRAASSRGSRRPPRPAAAASSRARADAVRRDAATGRAVGGRVGRGRRRRGGARRRAAARGRRSAGSLHTPALLLRSGVPNGEVGRRLRLHPVTGVLGWFDGAAAADADGGQTMFEGAPMTTVSAACAAGPRGDGYGCLIEVPAAHTGLMGAAAPWAGGRAFKADLAAARARVSALIVLHAADADDAAGRVTPTPRAPVPQIRYDLSARARPRCAAGCAPPRARLCAAGARRRRDGPPPRAAPRRASARRRRRRGAAAAPRGRARGLPRRDGRARAAAARGTRAPNSIGLSPRTRWARAACGADPRVIGVDADGESWELPGLWVADASRFSRPRRASARCSRRWRSRTSSAARIERRLGTRTAARARRRASASATRPVKRAGSAAAAPG